ncbi:MAG: CRISPR-associated endoribonuclease Cas6 [Candidatus Aenigmarchaeota archaeon]|nr:CRISPR-associated endoribonuclease Cas6 [Candidatus Aenigmarchaeota archaeon]
MRILIKLTVQKKCSYDASYFNKLQGFVYNLLKNTEYQKLHDLKGYKFFCFSNIFPCSQKNPLEEGALKHLMISSPDRMFIEILHNELKKKIGETVNIGEMQFSLKELQIIKTQLHNSCVVSTATPIIIRIPKNRYEEYSIESQRNYEFWRPEHDFNAFIKQLSENIVKKYNTFYEKDACVNIFQQFDFRGTYPINVLIENEKQIFIGSYWKFIFTNLNREQSKILRFGIDCGFGELNTLGFGFVNIEKSLGKNTND